MPWVLTTDAKRALLLATLCSELALGTTLDRRQELAVRRQGNGAAVGGS